MFNNEDCVGEYIETLSPPERARYLQELENYSSYIKERDSIAQRHAEAAGAGVKVVSMQQWKANKEQKLETQYNELLNGKINASTGY